MSNPILEAYLFFKFCVHFGDVRMTTKVLQSGFYWSTLNWDSWFDLYLCAMLNARRHEMTLNHNLEVEFLMCEALTLWGPSWAHIGISIFWWPMTIYQVGWGICILNNERKSVIVFFEEAYLYKVWDSLTYH